MRDECRRAFGKKPAASTTATIARRMASGSFAHSGGPLGCVLGLLRAPAADSIRGAGRLDQRQNAPLDRAASAKRRSVGANRGGAGHSVKPPAGFPRELLFEPVETIRLNLSPVERVGRRRPRDCARASTIALGFATSPVDLDAISLRNSASSSAASSKFRNFSPIK
jgi:hypothetical protein